MHRVPRSFWAAIWLFTLTLAILCSVEAKTVNRTIDDAKGDSFSGAQVQYVPARDDTAVWFDQISCSDCASVPNAQLAVDNTWTSALFLAELGSISISIPFSGTAIYVFFILPNFAADSDLASNVRCDFFLDRVAAGSFTHDSDGSSNFQYNATVFSKTGLEDGDHVLLIETKGPDSAVIIFDFALYTTDVPDETPSQPPAPSTSHDTANPAPGSSTDSPPIESSPPANLISSTASQTPTSTSSLFTQFIPSPSSTGFFISPTTAPTNQQDSTRQTFPVVAIIGGAAGAIMLVVLVLVFLAIRRRRQKRLQEIEGTVSVFDLLPEAPPRPPPPPGLRLSFSSYSSPISPTKGQSPMTEYPSMHSVQSSVSVSAGAQSGLRIQIPMGSRSNHSPITRNGVPVPPQQAEIVRGLLLGSLNSSGLRRGSMDSAAYTPSTEMGYNNDDDMWPEPVVHVDSGIRISRAMMELPPVYAAS